MSWLCLPSGSSLTDIDDLDNSDKIAISQQHVALKDRQPENSAEAMAKDSEDAFPSGQGVGVGGPPAPVSARGGPRLRVWVSSSGPIATRVHSKQSHRERHAREPTPARQGDPSTDRCRFRPQTQRVGLTFHETSLFPKAK